MSLNTVIPARALEAFLRLVVCSAKAVVVRLFSLDSTLLFVQSSFGPSSSISLKKDLMVTSF